MADIDKNHQPVHHALRTWVAVAEQIRALVAARQVHPSKVVVLVPYAQLIHTLRDAWVASASAGAIGFTPQFQSTMNWARSLGASLPQPDDLQLDPGLDALNARLWIDRAGLSAHGPMLVPLVVDAARSLAPVAAAFDPLDRVAWSTRMVAQLFGDAPHDTLVYETAVAQLALTWVGHSVFATDVLFAANPALMIVLKGFQDDPLVRALALRTGDRCVYLALDDLASGAGETAPEVIALHSTLDAQDEAQCAAACVLRHLALGRQPVGLVAVDRLLTRRVHALLHAQGVVIRDETGWKLSTARAAAAVVGLLKACAQQPRSDEVLDWLKNAPAFDQMAVQGAEAFMRQQGMGQWPADQTHPTINAAPPELVVGLLQRVNALRASFAQPKSLKEWLNALRNLLQASGHWAQLQADEAGHAVRRALMLDQAQNQRQDHDQRQPPIQSLDSPAPHEPAVLAATMRFADFAHWVNQTLEGTNFLPIHPADAQVIILPLSQLLGRVLPAVVLAGCDEARFPTMPEPVGPWTALQREVLGLASSGALAKAQQAAWNYALQAPRLDLLWRNSEGGEPVLANGYVQALRLHPAFLNRPLAADPRVPRRLARTPVARAKVQASALPVSRLSATAYNDLRQCPYRFFALRQLGLAPADELDSSLDKRDFGNWLHRVLFHFHKTCQGAGLATADPQSADLIRQIDLAADLVTRELGLSEAEFLPYSASWPQVRQGYLNWLAQPQNQSFSEGEVWQELQLGSVKLVGKLDRIDRPANGPLVLLDYKTEPLETTRKRIKSGSEDTQLPFYAALFDVQAVQGAYVNVGEREGTTHFAQPDLVALREQLAEGILDDMQRLADGHDMVAMGQGSACAYCAARGLCRKDMVSQA